MSTFVELAAARIAAAADAIAEARRKKPRPKRRAGRPLPRNGGITGDVYADRPPVPGGMRRDDVRATYHFYSPRYETATLACADRFRADPAHGAKLLDYPWTAVCLDKPFRQSTCGRCLRATNRGTGAAILLRAVDHGGCSDVDGTGLDIDPVGFDAIDTDGRGRRDGNMRVDVEEVECARPF